MSIFARVRQFYDRLCQRKVVGADRMRPERDGLNDRADDVDERERLMAIERDTKLLGLTIQ